MGIRWSKAAGKDMDIVKAANRRFQFDRACH